MEESPTGFDDLFDDLGTLQLAGRTEHGKDVWIPRFLVSSTTHAGGQVSWKGTAELFVEGDLEEFDASGGTIICSAFIPPTPLALPRGGYTPSYDGTVAYEGEERKGIRWNTALGEAELIDGYDYSYEKAGLDEALIRVRRCQVVVKIESSVTVSLKSVSSDLENALDEPLWLLSLLSRKRMAWYEAQIIFLPPEDSPDKSLHQTTVRRKQWLGYESERQKDISWTDLLAERKALVDGLFQQICTNYTTSPFKEVIRRSIPYILAAHEIGYIETRLGILYSALEGLVNGLDRGYILDRSPFDRLAKKLRSVIREEIEEKDVAQAIIKKVPELKRRSYADRLLMLFDEYALDLTKLWPPGADIPSEIQALIKRRDVYIHHGKIDDYGPYIFDLHRIQNLAELWILKLLGYPDTAINYLAVNRHVLLNRP